jgi:hypothetical protein
MIRDAVIRREHKHDCVRVFFQQTNSRETDSRRGISPQGFNNESSMLQFRHKSGKKIGLFLIRDNPSPFFRNDFRDTLNCLLNHRTFSEQISYLFRVFLAAFRPEASADTAGHDYGMKHMMI